MAAKLIRLTHKIAIFIPVEKYGNETQTKEDKVEAEIYPFKAFLGFPPPLSPAKQRF
jgi:hypothetical protein